MSGNRRRLPVTIVMVAAALVPAAARAEHELATGLAFFGTGYSVFGSTRASLRDPHFGMRWFWDGPAPGTLREVAGDAPTDTEAASAADGEHLFWDVAFGERMPIVGWYDVQEQALVRHARGVQLNLDAAAFALLDFSSQSSGVVNTDYRLGFSVDARPPLPYADRFSVSAGWFHQSTHLGDEYVLGARTIQRRDTPAVNNQLPFRANPSYNAIPITASWDWSPRAPLAVRLYAGTQLFTRSDIEPAGHPEWRLGAELQFDRLVEERHQVKSSPRDLEHLGPQAPAQQAPGQATGQAPDDFLDAIEQFGFGHSPIARPPSHPPGETHYRRGPFSVALKYELLLQRKFRHIPPAPGPAQFEAVEGRWRTHHIMLLFFMNARTRHSSSNALVGGVEGIIGRNQHGQLVAYHELKAVALSLSYYW